MSLFVKLVMSVLPLFYFNNIIIADVLEFVNKICEVNEDIFELPNFASSSAFFLSYCNIIIRWVGGYSKKYFHKMRPRFTSVRRSLKVGALFRANKKAASKRFQLRCAMNGWFGANNAALS